ncbi:MAG: tetratricopeptide repeat protein [Pseudomonadota bacterium]
MRTSTMLVFLLLAGCVWDRTGQSASEAWRREMAIQSTRTQSLQAAVDDATTRIDQLEEVTRARGQDEIMRMETVDQLRQEVARLRGDLELLQHEAGISGDAMTKHQEDAEFRLAWLESRAAALEKNLGLKPPAPPVLAAAEEPTGEVGEGGGEPVAGEEGAATEPGEELPPTPEERRARAKEHQQAGRSAPARAILQQLITSTEDTTQLGELRYLVGESLFKEGQYQAAILAFQEVVDKSGDSDRAPWAMLRQGQSFEALGQRDNAGLFYDDVIRLYPRSKAAKEAKNLKSR